MRKPLTLFFLIYTAVGVAASLVVHFLLYFGFSLYKASPNLWLVMHLSIFIGWVGLFFLEKFRRGFIPDLYNEKAPKLLILAGLLFAIFLPYALVNFVYCQNALSEGYPDMIDGQYALVLPHGQKPKKLTEQEYTEAERYQARKTSGHWMVCHLIPCMLLYTNYKWERNE